MKSINPRNCHYCHKDLTGKHFNVKFCDSTCERNFKNQKVVIKSHQVFNENNKNEWVECPCCSLRSRQLSPAHLKLHGFNTIKEFKDQYKGTETLSESLKSEMSARVSGNKNPAYQHDGKLSPFSKNFVKYREKTDNELESIFDSLYKKSANTKEENNSNPLTLEYYTGRGYSENEARELLRDRQSTFTFGKCIERFGEEEGKRIWMERQEKWQNTLRSKPQEEIDSINKRKSSKVNYRTLWTMSLDEDGYFYIVDLKNNNYKIGITSKNGIDKRYKKKELIGYNVIMFEKCKDINHAFQIEQLLKNKYLDKIFKNNSSPINFGWTEIINDIPLQQLIEDTRELLSDPNKSELKFKSTFKLKYATV
jgi:predicted GIY-YIG superfamily endonuclease